MTAKVPTAIKVARGNPGKRAIDPNEVKPEQPDTDELSPPSGMSRLGKKYWREIVHHLHRCGLYTVADENTLRSYCEAFAEWQEAQKQVWRLGAVVGRTKDDKLVKYDHKANIETFPKVNPWCRVADAAFTRMTKLIPHLGLSPSSRVGLNVKPPAPDEPESNDFSEFDDD